MINSALKFLAEQLNGYLDQQKKTGNDVVAPISVIKDISRLDEDALKTTNQILITLVNISEEQTLKNFPGHVVTNNDMVNYSNPPVNLNLYLLFTACMTNYENALIYLSHTINFFQGKNIFTLKNSSTQVEGLPDDMRIILDIYSLSFEQLNYLWSTLGGKQHPFICYKVRMVRMERDSLSETRGLITEVKID